MSERDVFRAAVIAAAASGALGALGYLQVEFLTGVAGGRVSDPWRILAELTLVWLVAAACFGIPVGLLCGILPTIVAVAVWPALQSRLGTAGAIGALSVMVGAIGAVEVAVSGGSGEDWPWAAGAGLVCGLTSAYALWLVKESRA